MVSITRYDDEVLRDFIEYHLAQGIDQLVFVAHLASDKVLDILDEYEATKRLNYKCFEEDMVPITLMTDTCRNASETILSIDPDSWIIPMDSDCFWWPKEGTIKDTLEKISGRYNVIEVPQQAFVPNLNENGKWYERMIYRDRFPHTLLKYPMPSRQAFKANTQVKIAPGHHTVDFPGKYLYRPEIECFHFSHITYDQFKLKIAIKGPMCEKNPEWLGNDYKMLRIWYNRYKANDLRQIYEGISYPVYQNVIVDRRMEGWFENKKS